MIVVPVILDVRGGAKEYRTLCTVCIINDGTGTTARGNYRIEVLSKSMKLMRKGRIENWPRSSKHVVDLVAEALKQVAK